MLTLCKTMRHKNKNKVLRKTMLKSNIYRLPIIANNTYTNLRFVILYVITLFITRALTCVISMCVRWFSFKHPEK
jgi:hypothetical protein